MMRGADLGGKTPVLSCSLSFVRSYSPRRILYHHARGETQKFVAKRYNTTSGNLSNWMKKNGIKEPSTKESYGGIGTYVL